MTARDLENKEQDSHKFFVAKFFSGRLNTRSLLSLGILLTIVALALLLRLNELGVHGFYVDEVYSALVTTGKGDPELIAFDTIRPVYFALLRLWMNFGSTEEWLRLFSVIFGTANILLTYCLARLVSGRKTAVVAAALMAFSPMEVHYSQLARMYTLGSFFALLGSIFFLRTWQTGKFSYVVAWACTRALMVLTLPLTVILLGTDVILAVWKERKQKLFPATCISLAAIVGLYLSFAWKMPQIAANSPYDEWRYSLPIPTISDAFLMIVNFTSTALPIQECIGPKEGGGLAIVYTFAILSLLSISIIAAVKDRWLIWCSAWTLVPVLVAWALSQAALTAEMGEPASYVITRYLMFASPFAFISIAAGWNELWRNAKLRVFAALCTLIYVAVIVLNLADLFTNPVHEDWREISNFISSHEKPGDKIVIWNYHTHYLLGYYYRGNNAIHDVVVKDVLDEKGRFKDIRLEVSNLPKLTGRCWIVIRQAPERWRMAWNVYHLLMQHLEKDYKVIEHDELKRTDVYLITDK